MRNVEQEIAHWRRRLESPEGVWDETILARARRGDRDAIQSLIERFNGRIAKIIDSRLGGAKVRDKEDLFQEALVQVVAGINGGSFKLESGASFLSWLVLVVTKTLADWLKREANRRRDLEYLGRLDLLLDIVGTTESESEDVVSALETMNLVRRAVESLEEGDRQVVILRYFQELRIGETADVLSIPEAEVRKRERRALTRLKAVLSGIPGFIEEQP